MCKNDINFNLDNYYHQFSYVVILDLHQFIHVTLLKINTIDSYMKLFRYLSPSIHKCIMLLANIHHVFIHIVFGIFEINHQFINVVLLVTKHH